MPPAPPQPPPAQLTLTLPAAGPRLSVSGYFDGPDLRLLYRTVSQRLGFVATVERMIALTTLPGDRVRIGNTVKPAYLHGRPATVIHVCHEDRLLSFASTSR